MTQLHSCSPEKGKERICKSYHSPTNFILATDTSPIKSNYTKGAFLWSDLDRDEELKVALRRKLCWERKVLSKIYTVNLTNHVIIMHQSIPAVPMHPPPLANPWALAFFKKKWTNSLRCGHISCLRENVPEDRVKSQKCGTCLKN